MNSLSGVTVIGLTGQSGAGKTTVCDVFARKGFAVINADIIAREVTKKGSPCLKNILDVFPECINKETEELDRQKMAQLVFNDNELLKVFNSIMYPYITTKILAEIRRLGSDGKKLVLLDAPTLFESRADDFCNYIVCVISKENLRMKRIIERDNISEDKIRSRFESQHIDDFYISRSDSVIYNNSNLEDFINSAESTAKKIKEMFNA